MINRSSMEAVRALAELAKLADGQFEGTVEIARKINAPANYLGKLLYQLARYGLVVSQKGTGGGFRLGKPADQISVYDVMACIEDVERLSRCFMENKQCSSASPCRVHKKWQAVRDRNVQFLKEVTLADL